MTVEHDSSLDGTEITPSDKTESPPASPGSARTNRLPTINRWIRHCLAWCFAPLLARWRSIVGTGVAVAAVGVTAGLFFTLYLPDHRVDDAAAHRAVQAASDGAVAVLSYSPDNLDRDIARAKSYLTGDFLAYYTKFSEQIAAMALQKHVTETAKVVRAAVSQLHPDSAVVLVFINQTATSKEKPEPQTTASIAQVTLTKVKGSWLISKLDPLS